MILSGCDTEVKHKHYYPDFYVKMLNTVIEIKSKYTLNLNRYLNNKKFKKN